MPPYGIMKLELTSSNVLSVGQGKWVGTPQGANSMARLDMALERPWLALGDLFLYFLV